MALVRGTQPPLGRWVEGTPWRWVAPRLPRRGRSRSARLSAALEVLRWRAPQLAAELGCEVSLVRRWLGRKGPPCPPPSVVVEWVERLARSMLTLPPPAPQDWRLREPAGGGDQDPPARR